MPNCSIQVPVADYRLAHEVFTYEGREEEKRACYSFCMCPGGQIVPTSVNTEELCVNGAYKRPCEIAILRHPFFPHHTFHHHLAPHLHHLHIHVHHIFIHELTKISIRLISFRNHFFSAHLFPYPHTYTSSLHPSPYKLTHAPVLFM